MSKKVLVIAGPTASGKTALSIELARRLCGEIVSADSMQIYRGMDIGTAKADENERAAAVHHMLDVAEPWESFSVSRYVEQAAECCEDILSRGKLPIITGGTGLYIDSLLSGRDFAETQEDKALRSELSARYDSIGGEAMLKELSVFDPQRAEKLHPSDRRRIIRAIEIYRLSGITATRHDEESRLIPPRYEAKRIVLGYKDRSELYRQIDSRVDRMLELGLFNEVEGLIKSGVSADSTAMQAIGYKELVDCIAGTLSYDEAVSLIKQSSRRYAKRQLTWFSRWQGVLSILWDGERDMETASLRGADFFNSEEAGKR